MFNWFQSLLPRTSDFFSMFEAHAATLVGGADALAGLLDGRGQADANIAEVNRREHEADDIIRQVLRSVRQTFLTPFDRGAITSLIGAMDDTIDEMQSTARAVALYEMRTFEPEMREMAAMITEAARLTAEAIPLLRDLSRNGARVHSLTEKVVRLETSADEVHARGLKRAFEQLSNQPMQFIATSEIYQHLERISDAFEDVANEIDGIVIDHA
jgi:predicted phosphate transport protein (TIGR00153 family)